MYIRWWCRQSFQTVYSNWLTIVNMMKLTLAICVLMTVLGTSQGACSLKKHFQSCQREVLFLREEKDNFQFSGPGECKSESKCSRLLVSGDRPIADSQITASTSCNSHNHQTPDSRICSLTSWIPGIKDGQQWLQYDFKIPTRITGAVTRGRKDAAEWVTKYRILYGPTASSLKLYTNSNGTSIFDGNCDQNSKKYQWFEPAFYARVVRINPIGAQGAPTLRADLLGCDTTCGQCLEVSKAFTSDQDCQK